MKRILFSLLFTIAVFTVVAPTHVHAEPNWMFKLLHPHQYEQAKETYKKAEDFRTTLLVDLDLDEKIIDACVEQNAALSQDATPLRFKIDVLKAAYKADISNVFDPLLAVIFDDIEGGVYHLHVLSEDNAS